MKRLAAQNPEKATGTSEWLAGVVACLRTKPGEEGTEARMITPEVARLACKRSAMLWGQMAAHEQSMFYAIAQAKAI
eukprot:3578926-Lingulodinium_polyedra.AAC.1